MRFVAAHKTATYLAVTCAFLALVLSGELGLVTVGAAAIGIAVSWWWEPPRVRVERWAAAWTAAGVVVFAWSALRLFLGGDVLLLGTELILFLQVAKLFARRELKDYLQIYVLSFLMLTAGTVLNSELTYGLFFLGYVVSASWALSLFLLRREIVEHHGGAARREALDRMLGSRTLVERRFFVGSSLISVGVFASAVALFVFIPRIGFGLFMSKSRGGVSMAGFSDGVQLGGHGLIRTDETVVMRVELPGARIDRASVSSLHWRGVAFDQYAKGGEWRRSSRAPETARRAIPSGPQGRIETYHLLYDQTPDDAALAARNRAALHQRVYLEPLGYDVLFGASLPLAFEFETSGLELRRRGGRVAPRNDEIRRAHTTGIRYDVYSKLEPPAASLLRAAQDTAPAGFEVYAEVPESITPRTRELALRLTAGAENDHDRLVAIERWLKANLTYSLEQVAPPPGQEPLDFFLFDRKKGHCEYFGSALAIMGRVAGVPTRSVNGFLGGEWNEYDEYIAVRAGDAHSWVEAYFPGQGWVTFDPTPSVESAGLGTGGEGVVDRMRRLIDTMRFKWFKWVIEYDLSRQLGVFRALGGLLKGGASSVFKDKAQAAQRWLREHVALVWAAILAVGAGVGVVVARRNRRRGDDADGGRRRRGPRHPATLAYLRVLRLLARHGRGKPDGVTPREHARALLARGAPGAAELAELCEIHYVAEYGGGDPALAARAVALAGAIEAAERAARRARPREWPWRRAT